MSEAHRRTAHAIYCDDVRQEIGNKLSLIGVYTGQLLVPKLPISLPKLCIVLEVRTAASAPFTDIRVEVLKNKEVLISAIAQPPAEAQKSTAEKASEHVDDSSRIITAKLVMELAPFKIEEGFLLRTVVAADGETLRAGGLVVEQQAETQSVRPGA